MDNLKGCEFLVDDMFDRLEEHSKQEKEKPILVLLERIATALEKANDLVEEGRQAILDDLNRQSGIDE